MSRYITILSLFLSVALHAGIFTGISFLSGDMKLKKIKINKKNFFSIETIESSDLPDIGKIDKESKIAKKENKNEIRNENVSKEEFGDKNKIINSNSIYKNIDEGLRYEDMIKLKIQKVRNYPEIARKEGIEGNVYLSFVVLKDGRVENINILESSGNSILDEEAVNTLKRAQPFPEIPEYYNFNKMNLNVKIIYKLR